MKKNLKTAVALKFKPPEINIPRVVAHGQGTIAEKIIALAKANNVPFYEDPDFVQILYQVNIGEEIPPEMFLAVAEILAYLYRMNKLYLQTT